MLPIGQLLTGMDGRCLAPVWSNRPAPPSCDLLQLYWPPLLAPYRPTEP